MVNYDIISNSEELVKLAALLCKRWLKRGGEKKLVKTGFILGTVTVFSVLPLDTSEQECLRLVDQKKCASNFLVKMDASSWLYESEPVGDGSWMTEKV